jgi:hypothetical protein
MGKSEQPNLQLAASNPEKEREEAAVAAGKEVQQRMLATTSRYDDERFKWGFDNPDVAIPEQVATAVYVNPWGQVVIRQERRWDEEADPYVVIDYAHLPELIHRLRIIADQPLNRDERPETDIHPVKRTGQ